VPKAGAKVRASDVEYLLDYAEVTSDVTLSTTAGTYTTLITGNAVTVKAGKQYRVEVICGAYLLSGGASFATGDTWRFRLERDDGGGFTEMASNKAVRTNVAIAAVAPTPNLVGYYSPATDDTVTFRARASKTSGNVAVTSTVSVDGNAGNIQLSVTCIGDSSGSLH
jgi:hypothetical protein